jgi:multiple sugar transport system substrate-binding protein
MKGLSKLGCLFLAGLLAQAVVGTASADQSFLDVGKQEPITILINSSPWLAGFKSVADLYQKQTGNEVDLDVTPYDGMLAKARAAVRGPSSPYDILNLDTAWTVEFYSGGFLQPLDNIEAGYAMPPEVATCGDSYFWNEKKQWRTQDGGELMAIPPNCNTIVITYRKDLFDSHGLPAPKTYADILKDCDVLQDRPKFYGFVAPSAQGTDIYDEWMSFMLGYGAKIVADPENGDFTVTVNSPASEESLKKYIEVMSSCGPANIGALGQSDVIQLMAAGKVAMAQTVIAAWASYQDPTQSVVAGKIAAAESAAPEGAKPGVPMGNWHFAVPKNTTEAKQKAALAFMKWLLTQPAQTAYAQAGGIPVRLDVLQDLSSQPKFAWMKAYGDSLKDGEQVDGSFTESPAVEEILGLRLNQALIGQLSPAAALNKAATEIHDVFVKSGRKTGMLAPLPE